MEDRYDFLEWLGPDTSTTVLMCLDNPADIARISSVSRSWRRFVIANGFYKNVCAKMYPVVSNFTRTLEVRDNLSGLEKSGTVRSAEWESLCSEHRTYNSFVQHMLSPSSKREIMLDAIRASSTDNYPAESIENTLAPSYQVDGRLSYWSSGGSRDPHAPETLTYRLASKLCVVHEIKVHPFQAYFQFGEPIYSAKHVRFRMGHSSQQTSFACSSVVDSKADTCNTGHQKALSDDYVWTYVSPLFLMAQENVLQSFKLPKPALCVGGILQIELLGRVQQQEVDNLYYICVCHVKVLGRSLHPKFDIEVLDDMGSSVLKYFPDIIDPAEGAASEDERRELSAWQAFAGRIRQMRDGSAWNRSLLNALLGNVPGGDEEYESGDDELLE